MHLANLSIIDPYKIGSTKLDFENFRVYTDLETPTGTWLEHAKKMLVKLKEEGSLLNNKAKKIH